jgi:deazaflavin-dependent oxidoreductase (nitroreductase family)
MHRFFMQRPVTAFFAPWIYRFDNAILNWTHGKFSAAEILGWPVIQLTMLGAKTNQPRSIPLVGVFDRGKIGLIASSLGREHKPGWYYNLTAHPECEVLFRGKRAKFMAREVQGEEYAHYWQMAVSYYAGYEKYKQRAAHRRIPIMLLEPKI